MKTITATELARNLSEILDRLAVEREELVIERNHHQVACLLPGPGRLTTLEALADVYRTLSEDAAATWEGDSRASGLQGEWSRLTRRSCPGAVKEGAHLQHSLAAGHDRDVAWARKARAREDTGAWAETRTTIESRPCRESRCWPRRRLRQPC
jgi:hypothetical protein